MTGAMVENNRIEALVEKARTGDRVAFDQLTRTCERSLRSAVEAQLGQGRGSAEVDDVVQETLVLAFAAMIRFQWRGEASFHSWMLRIARNVLIDRCKDSRRSRYLELPEKLPANDVSPSRLLRRDERFSRLERAVADLPPNYREVIRLSHIEGLKVREIASRMNRSEYAVKHLLARALRKLRESFGDTESLGLPDYPLRFEGGDRGEE